MTWRILAEDSIDPYSIYNSTANGPLQRRVNVRALLDTGGPHLVTFGIRTVIADPVATFASMIIEYETPNGELRTINPGPTDLSVISDASGAMWYSDMVLVIDKHYPLGDGPGVDPYGLFRISFGGGPQALARISYECLIYSFDGSSSVINIP